MTKPKPSSLKTRLKVVTSCVLLYCLLFNSPVFLYHSSLIKTCFACETLHVNEGGAFWYVKTLCLMLFWVFTLFFILSYNRVLFICVIPLIFLTSTLVTYSEYIQKAPVNDTLVSATFQTGMEEIYELIGWPVISFVMLMVVVSTMVIAYYLKHITPSSWRISSFAIVGFCVMLAGCFFLLIKHDRLSPWDFHPYDYTSLVVRYIVAKDNIDHIYKDKFNIANFPKTWVNDEKHPLYVVMVIGESVRADHLGLNGYSRNTTPNLDKETNLINFPHVSSCGTATGISVPCLMTRATRKNLEPASAETSFISIFRALGFHTYWVSEQTQFLNNTSPVTSISREAEIQVFDDNSFSHKNDKIPNQFYDLINHSKGNTLVVFHMIGSHWDYEWRYPSEFRHYTPVCMQSLPYLCSHEQLINSYDNSILYMDQFLSHTINILKNKNAIVAYVSDHGDYLGENGNYLHGQETEDQELRHVPMMWWVSDSFRRLHPAAVNSMQKKKNASLSHDVIFHSILDCAGITSAALDKQLSLCH